MAKQIKVIKCPQCGSSQQAKIEQDHYKCASCGTVYFLDNDDININVNHRRSTDIDPRALKVIKSIGIGAVILVIVLTVVSTCSSLFRGKNNHTVVYTAPPQVEKNNEDKFYEYYRSRYAFETSNKSLVVFTISERSYVHLPKADPKNGYYATFRELESDKILKEKKLDIDKFDSASLRTFRDGNTYVIINKRTLNLIDEGDMALLDVTEKIFQDYKEFSSGIAEIDFVFYGRGDGFKVMTNLGKEIFFYPQVKKVYNGDEHYKALFGMNSLLPGATEKIYYVFTSPSSDFKDEPIQLIRAVYKYNNGGPEDLERSPSWHKDFGGSGIFTDRSPYTKRLFNKFRSRVISYKDITPGRIYFKAGVKYFDEKVILIQYRPTIAEDAPHILQALDANTAEVKWTLDLNSKQSDIREAVLTSQGFLLSVGYQDFVLINTEGEIVKEYTLPTDRK